MPLANLYNRLCCQQAPLGSTDFRAGARALVIAASRALRIARTLVRGAKYAFHRDADRLGLWIREPQDLGLESRSGWCRRRELCLDCDVPAQGFSPGGSTAPAPSRAARSKPAPTCSIEIRARRNLPLTPWLSCRRSAPQGLCSTDLDDTRPREPFRSRAADHRDSMFWSTE